MIEVELWGFKIFVQQEIFLTSKTVMLVAWGLFQAVVAATFLNGKNISAVEILTFTCVVYNMSGSILLNIAKKKAGANGHRWYIKN